MKQFIFVFILLFSFNLLADSPDAFECYSDKEMSSKWFELQQEEDDQWYSYFANRDGEYTILIPLYRASGSLFITTGFDSIFELRFDEITVDSEGNGSAVGTFWSDSYGEEYIFEGEYYCKAYTL